MHSTSGPPGGGNSGTLFDTAWHLNPAFTHPTITLKPTPTPIPHSPSLPQPELWRHAISGDKYWLKPKCQLDRSCYCEADEHCADGFKCVPSVAFPQYNTCRPKVMN